VGISGPGGVAVDSRGRGVFAFPSRAYPARARVAARRISSRGRVLPVQALSGPMNYPVPVLALDSLGRALIYWQERGHSWAAVSQGGGPVRARRTVLRF